MPLIARRTVKLGPLRLHFTHKGYSSHSWKIGRWSWNAKTRRHRLDLPGPLSYISPPPPRQPRRKATKSTRSTRSR